MYLRQVRVALGREQNLLLRRLLLSDPQSELIA